MSVLVVLRGNSGSGKTTIARAVQQHFERAECLVVSQDTVRRIMLRERDVASASNIDLIEHIARFSLRHHLVVIVEGILDADRYSAMLDRLATAATHALHYCFDLTFEQTLTRHATRPQSLEFSADQMAQWYHGWQPLPCTAEVRLDATWTPTAIIDRIHHDILSAQDSESANHAAGHATSTSTPSACSSHTPGRSQTGTPLLRRSVRVAWFGTSLMEHFEAYHPRLVDHRDLAPVGSTITVESWRRRGYVHAVMTSLSVSFPQLDFSNANHGQGGATSIDVLAAVTTAVRDRTPADLAILGCGLNDVWRLHQGRGREPVGIEQYGHNIQAALRLLLRDTRTVLVVGEPPIGWDPSIDVCAANAMVADYNRHARAAATAAGAGYIDLWTPFHTAGACWGWNATTPTAPTSGARSLWSDGVHFSELGVELARRTVVDYFAEHRIIDQLISGEAG